MLSGGKGGFAWTEPRIVVASKVIYDTVCVPDIPAAGVS